MSAFSISPNTLFNQFNSRFPSVLLPIALFALAGPDTRIITIPGARKGLRSHYNRYTHNLVSPPAAFFSFMMSVSDFGTFLALL